MPKYKVLIPYRSNVTVFSRSVREDLATVVEDTLEEHDLLTERIQDVLDSMRFALDQTEYENYLLMLFDELDNAEVFLDSWGYYERP